jgi:hypothetical protein
VTASDNASDIRARINHLQAIITHAAVYASADLLRALKSQGAFAQYSSDEDFNYTAITLNTLKHHANHFAPGGFSYLDELRRQAYEAIEKALKPPTPQNTKRQYLVASLDTLKTTNQTLLEDLFLLSMILNRSLQQGAYYASKADAHVVMLCQREQRELLDMLTHRKYKHDALVRFRHEQEG